VFFSEVSALFFGLIDLSRNFQNEHKWKIGLSI